MKRDGGVFDQFTGATITPRAVVGAVRRALGDDPSSPRYIETVSGQGYRFVGDVEATT